MHSDITLFCVWKRISPKIFFIFMKIHDYALKTFDSQKCYEISVISKMTLVILADKRCVSKTK